MKGGGSHVPLKYFEKFKLQHSMFKYVVPLTILSQELDVHQVVKRH